MVNICASMHKRRVYFTMPRYAIYDAHSMEWLHYQWADNDGKLAGTITTSYPAKAALFSIDQAHLHLHTLKASAPGYWVLEDRELNGFLMREIDGKLEFFDNSLSLRMHIIGEAAMQGVEPPEEVAVIEVGWNSNGVQTVDAGSAKLKKIEINKPLNLQQTGEFVAI